MIRDGIECPAGICANFTSLNVGNVKFSVTSWDNIVTYIVGDLSTNCWSKITPNILFIPKGCLYQLNKGTLYQL
jgi:hypothetical protein